MRFGQGNMDRSKKKEKRIKKNRMRDTSSHNDVIYVSFT